MTTQTDKSDSWLPAIAFIAVMLFGVVVLARIVGWLPDSIFHFKTVRPIAALANAAAEPVATDRSQAFASVGGKGRCPECGVIVSMREIEVSGPNASHGELSRTSVDSEGALRAGGVGGYEFSVRLRGGAPRVIIAPNRTSWRVGDRVIIIDGTDASLP